MIDDLCNDVDSILGPEWTVPVRLDWCCHLAPTGMPGGIRFKVNWMNNDDDLLKQDTGQESDVSNPPEYYITRINSNAQVIKCNSIPTASAYIHFWLRSNFAHWNAATIDSICNRLKLDWIPARLIRSVQFRFECNQIRLGRDNSSELEWIW